MRQGLEQALRRAVAEFAREAGQDEAQFALAPVVEYAIFPPGSRLRPTLALAIACGRHASKRVLPAAVAIELIHSASLVHDDLPCFDDAPMRRGKMSTQRKFGTAAAVLAGDALLALGFRSLSAVACSRTRKTVSAAACMLMHGQARELSERAPAPGALLNYHAQKTGCLFAAAAEAGALAADLAPEPFAKLGLALGNAYQLADDLYDSGPAQRADGKNRHNDASKARPNASLVWGIQRTKATLRADLAELRAEAERLSAPQSSLCTWVDALCAHLSGLAFAEGRSPAKKSTGLAQNGRRSPPPNNCPAPVEACGPMG